MREGLESMCAWGSPVALVDDFASAPAAMGRSNLRFSTRPHSETLHRLVGSIDTCAPFTVTTRSSSTDMERALPVDVSTPGVLVWIRDSGSPFFNSPRLANQRSRSVPPPLPHAECERQHALGRVIRSGSHWGWCRRTIGLGRGRASPGSLPPRRCFTTSLLSDDAK